MIRSSTGYCLFPVIVLMVFSTLAGAQEEIFEPEEKYVGKGSYFKFNPIFVTETEYTDNLFTERSNKRSDWITTVSPGLFSSFSQQHFIYELEYQAGFAYYLHHPELDYTRHEVTFKSTAQLTSRLTLWLDEFYLRSIDSIIDELIETEYERTVLRRTLTMFNRNIIAPKLQYDFGRDNSISLYYRNTDYRADDPTEDDYRESYVEGTLKYWLNRRNSIQLKSHFTKGNFDLDTDLLNAVDFAARYGYVLTKNLGLYAEYGYGETDFEEAKIFKIIDDDELILTGREDEEDYDIHKFDAGFDWQLPQNISVEGGMGYFWRQGEGNNDDQGINSLFKLNKSTKNLDASLQWASGYYSSYFTNSDSGSSQFWRFTAKLNYTYRDVFEVKCRGTYGYREYDTARGIDKFSQSEREDYEYRFNTLFRYYILDNYFILKKLFIELEFNHDERDSNFDNEYYIVNQFITRLKATF